MQQKLSSAAVNILLLTIVALQTALSLPLASFAGFGSSANDLSLPRGDDENARVKFSVTLRFINKSYTHAYVSMHCTACKYTYSTCGKCVYHNIYS